jgi:ParB family transcriptional regulator, chromosome partitioning protein
MAKKQGLGKGLSALISSGEFSETNGYEQAFDIAKIKPNPFQPRMHIEPDDLVELADSIREHGVIQPLIVTKDKKSNSYLLIAGERRFRASQLAGMKTIPVVIKEASPQDMLELALIENVQREDLNALEEAAAFKQLQDEFGLTQAKIAKKMGKSRVAVTNKIRLLSLPDQVKEYVLKGSLSEGHARALLGLTDPTALTAAANIVIRRRISVRETEDLVRKINYGKVNKTVKPSQFDKESVEFLDLLSKKLGYSANIQKMAKGGKITIRFTTRQELSDLMKKML